MMLIVDSVGLKRKHTKLQSIVIDIIFATTKKQAKKTAHLFEVVEMRVLLTFKRTFFESKP